MSEAKFYEIKYGRWSGLVEKKRYYKHNGEKIIYVEFTTKTKSEKTRIEIGTISYITFIGYRQSLIEITHDRFYKALRKATNRILK